MFKCLVLYVFVMFAIAFFTGCATPVAKFQSTSGEGRYIPFAGIAADGCRFDGNGETPTAKVIMDYKSDNCTGYYESDPE